MLSLFARITRLFTQTIFPSAHDELICLRADPESLREKLMVRLYRNIAVLFPYKDDTIRALIWQLKYKGDLRAADLLGGVLADTILAPYQRPCTIVPIPLSARRLRERGYNQVALVAEAAARAAHDVVVQEHILVRTINTKRQTYLPRLARLRNIKNAFTVRDAETLRGSHIILLDDVVTTGSTMEEAHAALAEAGIAPVTCVALAH